MTSHFPGSGRLVRIRRPRAPHPGWRRVRRTHRLGCLRRRGSCPADDDQRLPRAVARVIAAHMKPASSPELRAGTPAAGSARRAGRRHWPRRSRPVPERPSSAAPAADRYRTARRAPELAMLGAAASRQTDHRSRDRKSAMKHPARRRSPRRRIPSHRSGDRCPRRAPPRHIARQRSCPRRECRWPESGR